MRGVYLCGWRVRGVYMWVEGEGCVYVGGGR